MTITFSRAPSCGVALNTSSSRPRALTFYLDIDCGTIIAEDGDGLEFMNARDDVGAIRAILMLDAGRGSSDQCIYCSIRPSGRP